ncbi:uncharacterized protein RJT20DRAFT_10138 [Scheffersomyces xylosifermentans]|uniref:uncharacterized protein n=1 Tax=Scheffersomyces xylosifermentans TaxID=1304137 RepID=UPI00315DC7F7
MSRRAERYAARHGDEVEDEVDENESYSGNSALLPFTTDKALEPPKTLHLFKKCFEHILESPDLQEQIQIVKGDLYNRDYIAAFNSDDKRFAYASRWTPARALAYTSLFSSLPAIQRLMEDPEKEIKTLCIGGGASSELVALASVFCRLKEYNSKSNSSLTVNIIDIADWTKVVGGISDHIKNNWIYNPEKFITNYIHGDVLDVNSNGIDYSSLDLITLLFTTNELFTEKRQETIRLLQTLNKTCKRGSLLLIAESAGSYSNITIGTKKFPVQFLIDMILVGKQGSDDGEWEIVDQTESIWYRINPKEVHYPMKLENMRFFYRLYRKK